MKHPLTEDMFRISGNLKAIYSEVVFPFKDSFDSKAGQKVNYRCSVISEVDLLALLTLPDKGEIKISPVVVYCSSS